MRPRSIKNRSKDHNRDAGDSWRAGIPPRPGPFSPWGEVIMIGHPSQSDQPAYTKCFIFDGKIVVGCYKEEMDMGKASLANSLLTILLVGGPRFIQYHDFWSDFGEPMMRYFFQGLMSITCSNYPQMKMFGRCSMNFLGCLMVTFLFFDVGVMMWCSRKTRWVLFLYAFQTSLYIYGAGYSCQSSKCGGSFLFMDDLTFTQFRINIVSLCLRWMQIVTFQILYCSMWVEKGEVETWSLFRWHAIDVLLVVWRALPFGHFRAADWNKNYEIYDIWAFLPCLIRPATLPHLT